MRKPNGYWTSERCLQEAQKYTRLEEFDKNSHGACNAARRKGWIKDYTWLKRGRVNCNHRKSKPVGYWTYENCYKEAQKYTIRTKFKHGSPGAYNVARQNGWLDEYDWMKRMCHKNWTYEECLEESKKYDSRTKFRNGCCSAYAASLRNGWLDEFTWLKNEHIFSDEVDCVYGYFFPGNAVYIGRTLIRLQRRRHLQHISQEKDSVYQYSKEKNLVVPEMRIIDTGLTIEKGRRREAFWVGYYKELGYTVLNRAKAGSIGAIGSGRWTKKKCYQEAMKYKTTGDFKQFSKSAYYRASKTGWLKEYTWLIQSDGKMRRNYYTYEVCKELANKCVCLGDFRKNSNSAYKASLKNGWLDDFFPDRRKTNSRSIWTYEKCYEEALKYKTRSEFSKACSSAYTVAKENGWLREYIWIEIKRGKWNYDTCLESAQKCKTRSEFKEQCQSAYDVAIRNGWLKDYTWLVDGHKKYGNEKRIWDYDSCSLEAKKYATRSEFQRNSAGAYNVARKNNWMKDYTWFADGRKAFGEKKRKWNYENCFQEARKYKSKSQFQKNCSSAYTAAQKNGWLKEYTWFVSGHLLLAETQRKWNKETCFAEAKKYTVRAHFKKNSSGAYNAARRNGWLDEYDWFVRK